MAREFVESDDEIYAYDRTFLGPPDLPWLQLIQAKYVTWGIWLVAFVVLLVPLEFFFGNSPGAAVGQVVYAGGGAAIIAWVCSQRMDRERPFVTVLQAVWRPRVDAVRCRAADRRARVDDQPVTVAGDRLRLESRGSSALEVPGALNPIEVGPQELRPFVLGSARRIKLSHR